MAACFGPNAGARNGAVRDVEAGEERGFAAAIDREGRERSSVGVVGNVVLNVREGVAAGNSRKGRAFEGDEVRSSGQVFGPNSVGGLNAAAWDVAQERGAAAWACLQVGE